MTAVAFTMLDCNLNNKCKITNANNILSMNQSDKSSNINPALKRSNSYDSDNSYLQKNVSKLSTSSNNLFFHIVTHQNATAGFSVLSKECSKNDKNKSFKNVTKLLTLSPIKV